MKKTQAEIHQIRFSRLLNSLKRQHCASIAMRILRKQIEQGIVPVEYSVFLKKKDTRTSTVRKARQRFNTDLKLKAAVMNRDRNCRRCYGSTYLEIHHIVPIHERPDLARKLDNLRLLCRRCHKKNHENGL